MPCSLQARQRAAMEVQLQKEAESLARIAAEGGAGAAAGGDPDEEDDSKWDGQPGMVKVGVRSSPGWILGAVAGNITPCGINYAAT